MSPPRRPKQPKPETHANHLRLVERDLENLKHNLEVARLQLSRDHQQLQAAHQQLVEQGQALQANTSLLRRHLLQLPEPQPGTPAAPAANLELVEAELAQWLEPQLVDLQGRANLPALLDQHSTLREVVRQQLLARIAATVSIDPHHQQELRDRLWDGLPGQPPGQLQGDWISQLPTALRPVLQQRWQAMCIQHWCEATYGETVEHYFLERAKNLEQVVYSMIRLDDEGMALEIYLRLLDDTENFNELARHYSQGDERVTLGLLGPLTIDQLHPEIRGALAAMSPGEIHEPVQIEAWHVLIRLESRWPARLDAPQRERLLAEMLDDDMAAVLRGEHPPHGASLQATTPFPAKLRHQHR